jgi:hypothetical protein
MPVSIVRLKQRSRFWIRRFGRVGKRADAIAVGLPQLNAVSGSVARVSTPQDQRNPIIGARITDTFIAVGNAKRIVAVVYSIWSGPGLLTAVRAALKNAHCVFGSGSE